MKTTAQQLGPPPKSSFRSTIASRALRFLTQSMPITIIVNGECWGSGDKRSPIFVIDDAASFFARLAETPMIGLGESFMAGEWRVPPSTDLADALLPFAQRMTTLIPPFFYRLRHVVLPRHRNPANTLRGARKNIEAHYDLSNELFASFLDPTLSYSSALFENDENEWAQLEAAQLRKIDAILDLAQVKAGDRVLEIGSGWGSLALRAAERGAEVVTLTLSVEQAVLARQRIDEAGFTEQIEVAVRDYRKQRGTFDAVVSVEMIEAVGEQYWPTYFENIHHLLKPGGRAALQAILMAHDRMQSTRHTYTWIHKYIFPGGQLPSLQALTEVSKEANLTLSSTRFMGQHYGRTLRLWRQQFLSNRDQVLALGFDETFCRMWEFYLAYCEAGFRSSYLDVAQLCFRRD